VVEESIAGAVDFLRAAPAGAAAAEEEDEDDEDALPPLPEGMDPQDEGAVRQWMEEQTGAMQARAQAREQARQAQAQAQFERQDREAKIVEELKSKVLSLDTVVASLLPRAKKQWQDLSHKTALGTLTMKDLVRSKK